MTAMEIQALVDEMNRAHGEFKATLARGEAEQTKFGRMLTDTEVKLQKINDRFDELEVKMQRRMIERASTEISAEDAAYKAAFNKVVRKGEKGLSELEMKALATDSDPDGGYLLPRNVRAGMIEKLVQFSPVRALATIESIGLGDSLDVPSEGSTNFDTGWTSERATRAETNSGTFALDKIPTFEQYAKPKATQKMLDDTSFDVEGWISRKVEQRFGVNEGLAFVSGNGVTQPEGLLTNADIAEVNSGDAALLTADGLIDLYFALPEYYAKNGTFMMKRSTLQAIRKFKNGTGDFVWQPALSEKTPATVLGQPYVEALDMPAIGAGNYPILFGDFKQGYVIVDRQAVRVLRDPYSAKPFIEFYTTRRVGGQVVLAEAIVKQKVSA
jgi:HK97 family phage major capsid protein